MKKLLLSASLTLLLTVIVLIFPKKAYAQVCGLEDITPDGFRFTAGGFSSQAQCQEYRVIIDPGLPLRLLHPTCYQEIDFTACGEHPTQGWYTDYIFSGLTGQCQGLDLHIDVRRRVGPVGLGIRWCDMTVNLDNDQGTVIGTPIGQPPSQPCTPPLTCIGGLTDQECLDSSGVVQDCALPDGDNECCLTGPGGSSTIDWGSLDTYDIESLFGYLYNFLLPIGVFIGVISIIAAGYSYMASTGRPDKVKDATERLTSAIVGIIFIVLSLIILRVIIRTLFGA